jgi:hypothetical protein
MSSRKRRFFFHYNKVQKKMSLHYDNKCYIVEDIECCVPCETRHRTRQPRLVMQGFCNEIIVGTFKAWIK